jgi:hypothetical protein
MLKLMFIEFVDIAGEEISSDLELDSNESDAESGGDDYDLMGAALEREFLGEDDDD